MTDFLARLLWLAALLLSLGAVAALLAAVRYLLEAQAYPSGVWRSRCLNDARSSLKASAVSTLAALACWVVWRTLS